MGVLNQFSNLIPDTDAADHVLAIFGKEVDELLTNLTPTNKAEMATVAAVLEKLREQEMLAIADVPATPAERTDSPILPLRFFWGQHGD